MNPSWDICLVLRIGNKMQQQVCFAKTTWFHWSLQCCFLVWKFKTKWKLAKLSRRKKKSLTKTFSSYLCFLAPSFEILLAFNIGQRLNSVRRNLGLTRNTRVWYVSFQHLQQAGCSSLVAHLIQERRSSKLFPNQEQVRTFDKKDLFSCSLSILG